MAVLLTETFEALVAGALGGQAAWAAQAGGATPTVQVVAGSLIDGVNAVRLVTGVATTPGGVSHALSAPMTAGDPWRITVRAFSPAGGDTADPFTFALTEGAKNYATDGTDSLVVSVRSVGGQARVSVKCQEGALDDVSADTAVADGTKFQLDIFVRADGGLRFYVNGGEPGTLASLNNANVHIITANNEPDTFTLQHTGTMPTISTPYDTFKVQSGAVPETGGSGAFTITPEDGPFTEANLPDLAGSQKKQDLYFVRQTKQEVQF